VTWCRIVRESVARCRRSRTLPRTLKPLGPLARCPDCRCHHDRSRPCESNALGPLAHGSRWSPLATEASRWSASLSRSLSGISSVAPLPRIEHTQRLPFGATGPRLFSPPGTALPCPHSPAPRPRTATRLPSRLRCSLASLGALLIPRTVLSRDETRDSARHRTWMSKRDDTLEAASGLDVPFGRFGFGLGRRADAL